MTPALIVGLVMCAFVGCIGWLVYDAVRDYHRLQQRREAARLEQLRKDEEDRKAKEEEHARWVAAEEERRKANPEPEVSTPDKVVHCYTGAYYPYTPQGVTGYAGPRCPTCGRFA